MACDCFWECQEPKYNFFKFGIFENVMLTILLQIFLIDNMYFIPRFGGRFFDYNFKIKRISLNVCLNRFFFRVFLWHKMEFFCAQLLISISNYRYREFTCCGFWLQKQISQAVTELIELNFVLTIILYPSPTWCILSPTVTDIKKCHPSRTTLVVDLDELRRIRWYRMAKARAFPFGNAPAPREVSGLLNLSRN